MTAVSEKYDKLNFECNVEEYSFSILHVISNGVFGH